MKEQSLSGSRLQHRKTWWKQQCRGILTSLNRICKFLQAGHRRGQVFNNLLTNAYGDILLWCHSLFMQNPCYLLAAESAKVSVGASTYLLKFKTSIPMFKKWCFFLKKNKLKILPGQFPCFFFNHACQMS